MKLTTNALIIALFAFFTLSSPAAFATPDKEDASGFGAYFSNEAAAGFEDPPTLEDLVNIAPAAGVETEEGITAAPVVDVIPEDNKNDRWDVLDGPPAALENIP